MLVNYDMSVVFSWHSKFLPPLKKIVLYNWSIVEAARRLILMVWAIIYILLEVDFTIPLGDTNYLAMESHGRGIACVKGNNKLAKVRITSKEGF